MAQTKQNIEKNRFELEIGEQLAMIDYTFKKSTNQIFLIHTEVPEELRGNGWGETLVKEALEIIKSKGYKLIPVCPFVVAFLRRHKNYLELLDETARKQFETKTNSQ